MTAEQQELERRIAELDRAIQTREREAAEMRETLGDLMHEAVRLRVQGPLASCAEATSVEAPALRVSDTEAMKRIQAIMSGEEWDCDTMEAVAEVVRLTGREIQEPRYDEEEEAGSACAH